MTLDVSILVCTYGGAGWAELARTRAVPSAERAGGREVIAVHEPAMTLEDVRNRAALAARGDWLCFLDGDDELEPGYVAAMTAGYGGRRRPAILAPAARYVDPRRPRLRRTAAIPNLAAGPIDVVNHCVIGTLVPRTLFLDLGGFRHGYGPYEDWELFLRLLRAGCELVYVPDAVYRVHVTQGSRLTAPAHAARVALHERIMAEHRAGLGVAAPPHRRRGSRGSARSDRPRKVPRR